VARSFSGILIFHVLVSKLKKPPKGSLFVFSIGFSLDLLEASG
jgi:hypothetical protein